MHILRLTKSPVAHSELQGVHLLRHFGVAHRMECSDISAWCTEMLAGSDLTSAQAAAGDAQAQDTPVPKSSPVVRVPLSNTLEAFVFPKGTLSGQPHGGQSQAAPSSPGVASAAAALEPPQALGEPVTRKPWETDGIYSQWVGDIEEPLEPLKQMRGDFLEPINCATLFGGLSSERQVLKLHSVPNTWAFSSDKKHKAVAFGEANFPRPAVHFMDALDFLDSDEGRDLFSGGELRDLKQFLNKVDILFVSTSCKPYSSARTGRKSRGTDDHDDVRLIKAFFKVAQSVVPGAIVFEQVYGFALSESKSEKKSPLQHFLADCDELLPDYRRAVFVIEGDLVLVFVRHRIYVIFIHNNYGGKASLDLLKAIVKASRN